MEYREGTGAGAALILPLYAWTLWRRWPLIGRHRARDLAPDGGNLPVNAPIFVKGTLVWAGYEAVKALAPTWMPPKLSSGESRVYGRHFGRPATAALASVRGAFIPREARGHGAEDNGAPDYSPAPSNPAAAAS